MQTDKKSASLLQSYKVRDEVLQGETSIEPILDSIPAGIIIIDEATHEIIDLNKAALEMLGVPKKYVVGKICYNFICPSDKGKCPITDLGQEVDKSERILLKAGKEKVPILKSVKKSFWNGRRCLIESFIDISDRKKMENQLRSIVDEWQKTFDAISDFIFILDKDFRIVKVNQSLCMALGKNQE